MKPKKLFAILLSLALVVGMIPAFGVTVSAVYSAGDIPGTTGNGTEKDPVIVDNYEELKAALENDNDLYIRVDKFVTSAGFYELQGDVDYAPGDAAIKTPVGVDKHLEINADVDIRAVYDSPKLYSLIYNQGWLYLSGKGSLSASFNASGYPNAIIFNGNPGVLDVKDLTLDATQRSWAVHGYAIWNASSDGRATIESGSFFGQNYRKEATGDISAMTCRKDSSTTIYGGVFNAQDATNSVSAWGLIIDEGASVTLEGGKFKGIKTRSALDDYVATDYKIIKDVDGSAIDTSLKSTEETVKVVKASEESGTPHTITVDDGTADKSTAKAGETVTISAEPAKEKFSFTGWTAVTEDARPVTFADRFSLNTTFVMPDCDVRMIPNYKYSGSVLTDFYVFITPPVAGQHPQAPTVNVDNYVIDSYRWGKITNSGSSTMTSSDVFEAGTGILYQCRVDLKAKGAIVGDADQLVGYVNGSTKTDGIDVMTFRLGLDKARVVGSFNCSSARTNPFVDVSESDYYYEPVLWAVDKGITNGTDATHFSPNDTCTRGQIVTFLWRAAGSPKPTSTTNPFTDVTSSDYYYNAVLWAVGKNITNGTSATTFGPNDGCTRGQVVTFLHRFENSPKPSSTTNPFVDVSSSEYYYTPVLWAVGKGITNGTDATHFSPDSTCTRGQIVTFLYRDMD